MAMAVRESGTWSGGEVTPGLNHSLKSRTCDNGNDAQHEAIASFIRRYWPGLRRGRGTQADVISLTVNSVTRKLNRNETEGEAKGKTKSNGETVAIEKVDRLSERETRKYLINGQGGEFRKRITYKIQYRDT
jgi:hypothetical protein